MIPGMRGLVKIEVITDGKVVYESITPNTLVLESPKILLANLVAHSLAGAADSFANSDPARPTITPANLGPTSKHAVTYLTLGYYIDGQNPANITIAATDTAMGATNVVTKLLTDVNLGEYSVDFVCSFEVGNGEQVRNYREAGLLCPALEDHSSDAPPDPEAVGTTYDATKQVLFAHQIHNAVQANVGSTIRYTWTITMQAPE
tara:strand:- start:973 stop:1584 length:612 start_codon:yes stop_codon:yes gene_type:complete